jgi:hypothetical protein
LAELVHVGHRVHGHIIPQKREKGS